MNDIVRPLTEDGLFGYDSLGQTTLVEHDGRHTITTHVRDVRDKICALCEHGWAHNGPAISDQAEWDLIEDVVHETCLVRHIAFTERSSVRWALVKACVRFNGVKVEPNAYYSRDGRWSKRYAYSAELLDHPVRFLIGFRKRVWSIEMFARGPGDLPNWEKIEPAFKVHDVTKEFSAKAVLLHAWSDNDMQDYVERLVDICDLSSRRDD